MRKVVTITNLKLQFDATGFVGGKAKRLASVESEIEFLVNAINKVLLICDAEHSPQIFRGPGETKEIKMVQD